MPQLLIYKGSAEVPWELERQIRASLRDEWPGPEAGDSAGPLIDPELHPIYFLLIDGDRLCSYVRTIWRIVAHRGRRLKLYGLGDLLTVPEYRHRGHGGLMVREATASIRCDPRADAGLLLAEPKLEALYRRSGWDRIPGLRVATGEHERKEPGDAVPMMLLLTATARAARGSLASEALALPGDEW